MTALGAQQWHDEDRAQNGRHQPCHRVQDCLDCKALNPYLSDGSQRDVSYASVTETDANAPTPESAS